MNTISLAVCFLNLAVFCHGTLPLFPESLSQLPKFKGKYSGKIVGGEPVSNCETYSYQVSVQRKSFTGGNSHFCGGSILDEKHVVTAGHCVASRSTSGISVVVGTHKLDTAGREGVRRQAAKFTVHENYSSRDVDNDIAVITLDKPLDLESMPCAKKVNLPAQDQDKNYNIGMKCYATGWGTTTEGGSTSNNLQVVEVPLVSRSDCESSYGADEISKEMICAGLKEGGKDSCQGDSGGPLVARMNSTSPFVLVGITSWGYGCARPEYFGVYTNVARFTNWLNAVRAGTAGKN